MGGDEGGGSLISPDGVALSQIVGVSASDISACTIKSRRRFLLAPAHPGSPGKRALKRLCLYVCLCRCVDMPRLDMHTRMISIQSKVKIKVTERLKF